MQFYLVFTILLEVNLYSIRPAPDQLPAFWAKAACGDKEINSKHPKWDCPEFIKEVKKFMDPNRKYTKEKVFLSRNNQSFSIGK